MKDKLTTMTRHILLIQIEENVFLVLIQLFKVSLTFLTSLILK